MMSANDDIGSEYVRVRREDLRRTLEHLDRACQQIGSERCEASFVWFMRQALRIDGPVSA